MSTASEQSPRNRAKLNNKRPRNRANSSGYGRLSGYQPNNCGSRPCSGTARESPNSFSRFHTANPQITASNSMRGPRIACRMHIVCGGGGLLVIRSPHCHHTWHRMIQCHASMTIACLHFQARRDILQSTVDWLLYSLREIYITLYQHPPI